MSVLETFYILFKSDADKAAEGLDKVDDAADKAERSLKGADRATKETARSAKSAATSATGLAAATAAADANAKRLATSFIGVAKALAAPLLGLASAAGLTNLVTGRAENIRQLDQFSAKLNSSISDVDAFQRSVQELGGQGSQALDSLVKLGEKVNEAFSDKDSGARKDFKEWGLAFKDAQGNALGAADAMLVLAENLEGVSRAEALARIKKLGIEDAATIELLLRGRSAVERYMTAQKELGVVTEEQAEATRQYYEAWGSFNNQLTSIGNTLVATFLPALTRTVEGLSGLVSWATENQHLIEGFFTGVAGVVTALLVPALAKLGIATLAATWPWLLLALAVVGVGVAFALAWEDFKAWQEGQPSLLGELLGDYKTFTENLEALFAALTWDNFTKNMKSAFTSVTKWGQKVFGDMVDWIKDQIAGIPGAIQAAIIGVGAAALTVGGMGVGPAVPAGTDLSNPTNAADYLRSGQWVLNNASSAPQALATPGTTNNSTTVTTGPINIQTQATDAEGIAREVSGALKREFSNTSSSLDDGVAR